MSVQRVPESLDSGNLLQLKDLRGAEAEGMGFLGRLVGAGGSPPEGMKAGGGGGGGGGAKLGFVVTGGLLRFALEILLLEVLREAGLRGAG